MTMPLGTAAEKRPDPVHISEPEPIEEQKLRPRTRWRARVLELEVGSQIKINNVSNQVVRTFCWKASHKLGRSYRTRIDPWTDRTTVVQRVK